ncbi:unnamed protein product [Pieris macdunnoughi]|uniref:Uncharacterized protein n=1 Tax=Pieris macdunnoughi TaxID=345717 RepID=A0A821ULF2_9NEOP|nr:unnamed protein product [Pieris macdunnoughi]
MRGKASVSIALIVINCTNSYSLTNDKTAMSDARSVSDSECSSCEEDVDSGIADEPAPQRRDIDCMDLAEFFAYW